MSDEPPYEVGSRRRRRELRESEEYPDPASGPVGATPFDQVVSPVEAGAPADAEEGDGSGEDPAGSPDAAGDQPTEEELREGARIGEDVDGTPILITSSSYGRGYQTVTPVEGDVSRTILKNRREKRRRRNITLSIAVSGFVALMVGFVVVLQSFLGDSGTQDYEAQSGEMITFTVNEGDGMQAVANRLVDEGIIASQEAFDEALDDFDSEPNLQPDEYAMREEMPAADALAVLFDEGDALHYIAINTGIRIDAAFAAMSDGTGIDESEFRGAAADPTDYGLPEEAESLEGYIAPGEYRPELDATPQEIIQEMVDTTFERLEEAGVSDSEEQYEVIIKASLLTAEGVPGDYATIAGIIENRLDPNNTETDGRLQIDASLIYGLDRQGLEISRDELQDESNRYNTHANRGLPPGPIEAPSADAIAATANPDENDYYYWVTTNIETGETKFAEDYEQHQVYVAEYNEYCEENPDICQGEPAPDHQGPDGQ